MAWRIHDLVLEGELDNTVRGLVQGWLRVAGKPEPIDLELLGNCHPDLAGWKIRIVRLQPVPAWEKNVPKVDLTHFDNRQHGYAGDITGSQKVRGYDCSDDEFLARTRAGEPPPTDWRKALYLEWTTPLNGRVVIQDWRLGVELIGEDPAFRLTEEEYRQDLKAATGEIVDPLNRNAKDLGIATIVENPTPLSAEEIDREIERQLRKIDRQIRRLSGDSGEGS